MSDNDPEIHDSNAFPCPNCGVNQEKFDGNAYGWTKCPSCGKKLRIKEIPPEFLPEPESTSNKSKPKPQPIPSQKTINTNISTSSSNKLTNFNDTDEDVFNRPTPDWKILENILTQFNVAEKACKLIVARAQRTNLSPEEVQRMLGDLKTGLQKTEITYVADEYYYALKAEREKQEEIRGIRHSVANPRDNDFGGFRTSSKRSEPVDDSAPAWERERYSRDNNNLTREDFERMWEERIEKQRQEQKIDNLEQTLQNMNNTIQSLQNQLQQAQNSPPKEDKAWDIMMMMMKKQETDNLKTGQFYTQILSDRDKMYDRIIDTVKSSNKSPIVNSDGYKSDEMRLVADSINTATEIMKENKPLQVLSKGMQANQKLSNTPPIEDNPVKRKKQKDMGILDEIPEDMVSEDE